MVQLSVIIPVYNVEQYIEKCIQSVITNDLPHDALEIIVVDDESPDRSIEKVQPIADHYPFIRIISQKNKGLGGARNTGIQNATGNYLLFLDSDDWVLPGTLKSLVAEALNSRAEILEFAAQGILPDGKIVYHFSQTTSGEVLDGISYYNRVRYMNSACNKLYSRKLLVDNGLLFLERIFIEDFEFNTRVFLTAKRVVATDALIAQYLQSPNSITRNTDSKKQEKMVSDILHVLKVTQQIYSEQENTQEKEAFFKERLGFIVATVFYQLFKNKSSVDKILQLRKLLIMKGLFYVDFPLHQKEKNIFRILFLKNFLIFRIAQIIKRTF